MRAHSYFFTFLYLLVLGSNAQSVTQISDNMVLVEGGAFIMGNENGYGNERPLHPVTITSFYIDRYEVTNLQYCAFLNAQGNLIDGGSYWIDIKDKECLIKKSWGKYRPKKGFENHPVVEVTWYGAEAYAHWAGKRLPTEAEWEYAARGGKLSGYYEYAGSSDAESVAWFCDNSPHEPKPVGTKRANELGIYDMSGNVWEWCSDWYRYYDNESLLNPQGPTKGTTRVLRGGSWDFPANAARTTYRYDYVPTSSYSDLGFRCVRDVR